jgi:hypothetical protein
MVAAMAAQVCDRMFKGGGQRCGGALPLLCPWHPHPGSLTQAAPWHRTLVHPPTQEGWRAGRVAQRPRGAVVGL